jgi:TP901 family phage tail tape measure protein
MFSSSNSALINVGVSMVLQDHFSGPAGNVVSSWNKMLGDIGTYQRGLTGAYTNNLNMGIGMINSMKEAFEYSAQVQKNTWLTNTMINDGMNHQADLMKSAQEINLRNPLTAQDITSGQKFMAMAGMTFDKIKEASEPAAQLAAIFDMDIGGKGGTADLMTNIMSTFNIEASRATEIADGMFTATTSANMSLQDLAQSIKYSASTAKIAGVDYQQLSAYIGVLGNRGIQGSMAGTNFAQAISQMLKGITGQTKTGGNAMKLMGLTKKDFTDAAGNALPLQEILQKVASATNHLNSVDRFSALQGLFGTRGLRAASILIEDVNNGSKEYLSLLNKIKGSTGTLDKSMQDYLNTPQGRIDTLNSAFENLKVNIGAALSNVFIPIMRVMSNVANIMDSISQSGFGKWLISGVGIGIFFGTARAALGFIKMSLRVIRGDFLSTASNATKTLTAVRGTGAASTALELHLRMCNELLQRMAFNSGVVGNNLARAKNGQPFLPLGNGYRYSIDKNGNPRYTNAMGRVVPVGSIYGGNTAASAASVASGVKNMTHGAEVVNRARSIRMASMIGTSSRAIQTGIRGVSAGIGVLGTVGRGIMGFLGGPWGLAITAGISFLPMIFDWLQGDHRSEEEKRAAQEASEMARLEKAVRDGTLARIQVNINGQTLGTFTNGDTVSTNLPMSGGSDDSLYGF